MRITIYTVCPQICPQLIPFRRHNKPYTLVAGHLVYVTALCPALVRRGWLDEEDVQRTARGKAVLKKLLKVAIPATAACLVLAFALQAAGPRLFTKPEKFTSWAVFEDYMRTTALLETREEWEGDGYTVEYLPDGYQVLDGKEPVTGHVTFDTDTITDEAGNVLCTYPVCDSISLVSCAFDKSDDGLPVKVWTQDAMRRGYGWTQSICDALYLAAGAAWVVCAAVYLIRRKKA